jgi:signal transduction histidine kinase
MSKRCDRLAIGPIFCLTELAPTKKDVTCMSAPLPPDSSGPEPGSSAAASSVFGRTGPAGTAAAPVRESPSPLITGGAAAVVGGAGLAWALAVAPSGAVDLVAAGGGTGLAVTVAAVVTATQQLRSARRARAAAKQAQARALRLERDFAELGRARRDAKLARREADEAAADRASVEAEAVLLAGAALPAAFGRLRAGDSVDLVLAETARPSSEALGGLIDLAVAEFAAAERQGATAMAACASAAARIQAQTTRMLAELREMEQRHGDEKVFGDLIELDHRVSQLGRLADSIALLAGGRSGRRWTRPIPMESLLRGAMGRIDAYQRVRIHSTSNSAVAGYAAEGVMHALAELMDNATAFSTHGSEVHVYVEEEDVGVVITIEDSGLGMRKRERDRAEVLVARPLDLTTLPGTRLGLAVVGKVADRYGLSVNFRPSSRGGTGVVVMVPRSLITQPKPQAADGPGEYSGTPAVPSPPEVEERSGGAGGPDDDDLDADLPVRPRGRTLAAAMARTEPSHEVPPARTPRETGSRFAAFRESGRGTPHPAGDTQDGQPRDETAPEE